MVHVGAAWSAVVIKGSRLMYTASTENYQFPHGFSTALENLRKAVVGGEAHLQRIVVGVHPPEEMGFVALQYLRFAVSLAGHNEDELCDYAADDEDCHSVYSAFRLCGCHL